MSWWYDNQQTRPRDVKGGIKARSKRGTIGKSWWAQRWTQALKQIMDSGRLSRGRSYARRGHVINIDEEGTVIRSRVQGSRKSPYKVTIQVEPLSDENWERVLDVLADQAIFTAQLLAGEMPIDIEDVFSAVNVNLFPVSGRELDTNCSCPDWSNPCKHIAAVYFLLGEAFDDDPFMLFRLRGRTQEQILKALRARRATFEDDDIEPDHHAYRFASLTGTETSPAPLPEAPLIFWEMGLSLDDFQIHPTAPRLQLSLLQRLGNPSFVPQKMDLYAALGPAYQEVTKCAQDLAFEDMPQDEKRS